MDKFEEFIEDNNRKREINGRLKIEDHLIKAEVIKIIVIVAAILSAFFYQRGQIIMVEQRGLENRTRIELLEKEISTLKESQSSMSTKIDLIYEMIKSIDTKLTSHTEYKQ